MKPETKSRYDDRPTAQIRDGRFSVLFSQISRALSQQMSLYARRELGLNLAEYRTLSMLAETSAASIREIAGGAELDKAQVTRAVADLRKQGLVLHSVDKHDRRLRVVRITSKGKKLVEDSIPFAFERQGRMEQSLTRDEIEVLWKALGILKAESLSMLEEQERLADAPAPKKTNTGTKRG